MGACAGRVAVGRGGGGARGAQLQIQNDYIMSVVRLAPPDRRGEAFSKASRCAVGLLRERDVMLLLDVVLRSV